MIHSSQLQMQMQMQDTLDRLAAMRRQEEGGYATRDCFHQQAEIAMASRCALHIDIDIDCRDKMCEWCYQIVKFCKFSRETVEIAMSYLDRFMLTPAGTAALADRNIYQLASMTCLYTAVKIHERQALHPQIVSQLSRGTYTEEQIEQMEIAILTALEWRMNPPTALSFVREYLRLIPNDSLSQQVRKAVMEITNFQIELAVSDYKFISTPASTIAYCSFMNALDSIGVVNKDTTNCIGLVLAQSIGLDSLTDQVLDAMSWLDAAVVSQKACFHTLAAPAEPVQKHIPSRRASFEESPRTVSSTCLV